MHVLLSPLRLTAAYCLDLLAGDPRRLPHPVRWIGALIGGLEKRLYRADRSAGGQRLAGALCWLAVVAAVALGVCAGVHLAGAVHPGLAGLLVIWLTFSTLATRSLHRESNRVIAALEVDDLDSARRLLAMIVSRDTDRLDRQGVLRAVLETVAENLADGVVAPLFYLAVGGVYGGLLYKAVNTMDSMLGYTNERYRDFGRFAARADDYANWLPARLSGLLIIAGAVLLRLDWRSGWRVMCRDAAKTISPNAGFPEAAAAGVLGVQLGGTGWYFGRPVVKPTLGDARKPLTIASYRAMTRLLYVTSGLALLGAVAVRYRLGIVWPG